MTRSRCRSTCKGWPAIRRHASNRREAYRQARAVATAKARKRQEAATQWLAAAIRTAVPLSRPVILSATIRLPGVLTCR